MGRELKDFVAAMQGGVTTMVRLEQESAREKHYAAMEKLYGARENMYNSAAAKNMAKAVPLDPTGGQQAIQDAESRAGGGNQNAGGQNNSQGGNPGRTLEASDLQNPNALVDKIVQGESDGNWNAVYGGAKMDLSKMTIAQVQQLQQGMKQNLNSTAVGGPQFIQSTLAGLVHQTGMDPNTTYFTPDVQRQLAVTQINNGGFQAFKAGKISQGQFLDNLSEEWAALPGSNGAGHWDGYNGNKARVALGSSITQGTAPVTPVQRGPVGAIPAGGSTPATPAAPKQQPAAPSAVDSSAGTPTPAAPSQVSPTQVSPSALPVAQQPTYQTPDGTTYAGDNAANIPGATLVPAAAQQAQAQQPTQAFAEGGEVGNDVDQEAANTDAEDSAEEQYGEMEDQGQAQQMAAAQPEALPVGPAQDQQGGPQAQSQDPQHVSSSDVADAVHAGLGYLGQHYGLSSQGAVPDETHGQNVKRFASNEGAPSSADIDAARRAVDPDGHLTEGQRNMVALYQGWKFFIGHGDPNKAASYAGQFLMAARAESQAAGERAQAALKQGDMGTAAKDIQKAYDSVPDGVQMQVGHPDKDGVPFRMLDENGQVTQQGKATMDQLMYITTGMKNGSAWFDAMSGAGSKSSAAQQAAQQRQQAATAFDASRNPQQLSDFEKTLNPQQLQLFNQMTPQDKMARVQQFQKQQVAQVQAQNDQMFAQKYGAIRQAQDELQGAIQQSGGATNTDIVSAAQMKLRAAQNEAVRWVQSDPGRASYVQKLEGNLFGRSAPGASPSVAGAPAAPGAPRQAGTSKTERANSAIDADTAAAIKTDRSQALAPLNGMSDEDFRNGGGATVAGKANSESALDVADGAYRKATQGTKGLSENSRLGGSNGNDIYAPINQAMKNQFGETMTKAPEMEDSRNAITGVATKLLQGNQVSPQAAVRFVKVATDPDAKMQIDSKTGRVRFGDKVQPMYLDREGITMLANLRGQAAKKPDAPAAPPTAKGGGASIGSIAGQQGPGPADPDKRSWLENAGMLRRPPSQAAPATPGTTGNQLPKKPAPAALPITGFNGAGEP